MYTVKQLSSLAHVSVRTLHYYDEIGLLRPSEVRSNGYRYYDEAALLRLQQILFYREMGLELLQIKDILDQPDFDLVAALRSHREALRQKIKRLHELMDTVDQTIAHIVRKADMSKKRLFQGFDEATQKQYEREARLEYGPDIVNESIRRYNSYTAAQKAAIGQEGTQVYVRIVEALEAGKDPDSPEVQEILQGWHQHLRYFYEPTLEILRGLGVMYNTHSGFIATFQELHPDLPAYLEAAITRYVDDLETAEIERMLVEDEMERLRRLQ